jgi:hypothetical protein
VISWFKVFAFKVQLVYRYDSDLQRTLELLPDPWEGVTEEQLVALVTPWYARPDKTRGESRKYVRSAVIQPKYGNFDFSKFGHGSLSKFLERHGFESEGHIAEYAANGHFSRRRFADTCQR